MASNIRLTDEEVKERFVTKTERATDGSGCLLWTAYTNKKGYGCIQFHRRVHMAHRVAYMLFVGPIPDGYEIDHVKARGCVHRNCVEISHLEAVTQHENKTRKGDKDWYPCGHPRTPENTRKRSGNRAHWGGDCAECDRQTARRKYRDKLSNARSMEPESNRGESN